MAFDVRLTEEEFVNFSMWHYHKQRMTRLSYFGLVVFVLTSIAIGFWGGDPLLVITGAVAGIWGLFLDRLIERRVKRVFRLEEPMREQVHYEVSEDGITWTQPSLAGRTSWDNLHRAVEAAGVFAFYITRNQAFIIPGRCLSEGGTEQLRAFILARLPADRVSLAR
jgi:hypothetical protein